MQKDEIADILKEIGVFLELKGENPFKTRAYQNGARTLESLTEPLAKLVEEERLGDIKGIGKALAEMGLKPILETTGGGSDANVFIEKGISAIPVGIGVRDFHTTWETAVIAEVLQGAQMCQGIVKGA